MATVSTNIHGATGITATKARRLTSSDMPKMVWWTREITVKTKSGQCRFTAFGDTEEDVALTVEE